MKYLMKRFVELYDSKNKDFLKAFWLTLGTFIIIVLIFFGAILITKRVSIGFYHSAEEFIHNNEYVWVLSLGLIGIFYAVRAMNEANSALVKSRQIFDAISSFFDNYDQATERIYKLIREANDKLLICVSLPAYGVIVDEKLGDKFYSELFKRLPDTNTKNLEIQFICFNQELCSKYEVNFDTLKNSKSGKKANYMMYKETILTSLFKTRVLHRNNGAAFENVWLLGMDTHIRLFIADDSKAIFATVPDFKPDNAESSIAGFETTEKKMVEILIKLFEEQKMSGSPMSDSDFKTFEFS
jgi:hypothetical protein